MTKLLTIVLKLDDDADFDDTIEQVGKAVREDEITNVEDWTYEYGNPSNIEV